MNGSERPSAATIRAERAQHPEMRERDFAAKLGISEAEFVAAYCGTTSRRIEVRLEELLPLLGSLGEVMALTRNESAVHEKIGVYEEPSIGKFAATFLGEDIDLRIFPKVWAHGFAVEKPAEGEVRRSLQFFDAAGDAVHKVHLRPASELAAYEALVDRFVSADQRDGLEVAAAPAAEASDRPAADVTDLRERWKGMTDVHQFVGILRALKLTRQQAVQLIGDDFAWPLDTQAVGEVMERAASAGMPIMCFVGNRGCIQIHSGPIRTVRPMGPWINVMDPTFHLHLRADHIRELWAVRKPNAEGHVTSIEAYDANGELIIQFFGKRTEGEDERGDWRALVESLVRLPLSDAA